MRTVGANGLSEVRAIATIKYHHHITEVIATCIPLCRDGRFQETLDQLLACKHDQGLFLCDRQVLRFNYDYSDAELEELAEPITRVARNSFITHVILNNNHEDQGQRNAATLRTILQSRKAHAQ